MGTYSWPDPKVREITKVAMTENEKAWLDKARRWSCRHLEKAVRQDARCSSGRFHTIRISMPEEVLNLWVQCEEIAERQAERTLEPWQILEQMMAEYLSTYAAAEKELISHRRETEDEQDVPLEVRLHVLERDGHRCQFPGCSMRAHLGLHHIRFRSQGGGHEPENLLVLCDAHHTLIHDRICSVEGTAPDHLEFKGPFLSEFPRIMEEARKRASGGGTAKEEEDEAVNQVEEEQVEEANEATSQPSSTESSGEEAPSGEEDSSEDWRDETVAAIFDGPPLERPEPPAVDPITPWLQSYTRQKRKDRLMRGRRGGRAGGNGREHVVAGGGNGKSRREHVVADKGSSRHGKGRSVSKVPTGNPP
jgi:hypothetical protein